VPLARRSGSALSSSTSACSASISSLEHLGLQREHLEQLVEPLARLRRDVHADHVAAELLGHEVVLHQSLAGLLGIRLGEIAFIHRDHDRAARRLRVLDRFHRLRHHALGGRHDEHDEVRHGRAPGAHRRKGGMPGCVDEGQAMIARLDLIGAHVLGDPAGLRVDDLDLRLADCIEQRGLAVVDMAHHGDHRRTRAQPLGLDGLGGGRLEELRFLESHVHRIEAHLARDLQHGVEVDALIHRNHDPERHQLALNRRGLDAGLLGELADADVSLDLHLARLGRGHDRRRPRRELVAATGAGTDLRPRRGGHRAALAGRATRNLARELLLLLEVHDLPDPLALLALAIGLCRAGTLSGLRGATSLARTRRTRRRCRRRSRLGPGLRCGCGHLLDLDARLGLHLGLGSRSDLFGPRLFGDGLGHARLWRGDLGHGFRLGLRRLLASTTHDRRAALAFESTLDDRALGLLAAPELLAEQLDLIVVE
jgi:hypothetical protein